MQFKYTVHLPIASSFEIIQQQTIDRILTGEQITEASEKYPPEDYILLHLQKKGILEEINQRETVDLSSEKELFFIFKSDRTYNFELNGRRHPWGENTISNTALRLIGNIPKQHRIWLEKRSEADIEITNETCVNLDDSGLEKVYSKQSSVRIIINGKPKEVNTKEMSFSEIVKLAFPNHPTNPNTAFTVTFKRGCDCSCEGSLVKGETVCIKNGEVFNVTATDKS